jgi:hypothetical protein
MRAMVRASEGKRGNRESKRGDGDTSEFSTTMVRASEGMRGINEGRRGGGDASDFLYGDGAEEWVRESWALQRASEAMVIRVR